jgi:uncharacterized membrane protein
VLAAGLLWAALFGWLAVTRHLAGGSHAEDLGFTDQVIANFLRGQWFRMSIYHQATWNTELDISRIARPDSLLAFHVEPMLLLFVPLYALGGGVVHLLVLQALVVGLGAVPAYQIAACLSRSTVCGLAVAASYLLSPFGQAAVLADFHTSTLAGPLLLLAVERLVVGKAPKQALIAVALALSAREDVGPVVALLGLVLVLRRHRPTGWTLIALGAGWTLLCLVVLRYYAGPDSAFAERYVASLGNGLAGIWNAVTRPTVLDYLGTLALGGGWLGVLSPLALVPAVPGLALNALASSPWMASGLAHYSGLVLPFITLAAADGLRRIASGRHRLQWLASIVLILGAMLGYALHGRGPLGGSYAPATVTGRSERVVQLASTLPESAAVSASSSLVPHLSRRPRIYLFPTVADADHVFLDLRASPAPTSPGDVFMRVQSMLAEGGWQIAVADDGLLLLERSPGAEPVDAAALGERLFPTAAQPLPAPGGGGLRLVDAMLVPSPEGAIEPDGPRWILRTTWLTDQRLPPGTQLEFWLDLRDGTRTHTADLAELWWRAPDTWPTDQAISVDVRNVPMRAFASWQATVTRSSGDGRQAGR